MTEVPTLNPVTSPISPRWLLALHKAEKMMPSLWLGEWTELALSNQLICCPLPATKGDCELGLCPGLGTLRQCSWQCQDV